MRLRAFVIASHAAHGVLLLRGKDKPKKGKPAHWQVMCAHVESRFRVLHSLARHMQTWPMPLTRRSVDHCGSNHVDIREIISIVLIFYMYIFLTRLSSFLFLHPDPSQDRAIVQQAAHTHAYMVSLTLHHSCQEATWMQAKHLLRLLCESFERKRASFSTGLDCDPCSTRATTVAAITSRCVDFFELVLSAFAAWLTHHLPSQRLVT